MTKSARFVSLDVFRGGTIFLMILVNTAGPGARAYEPLIHAKWIGFTLADLIFPTFLFAMGNAMSFAMRRPLPAAPYLARLLRRGAIIFALGFLMYWFPFVHRTDAGWDLIPFAQTRVPGVLQRLALCYVLAGVIVRWADWRVVLGACGALLLGYWAILLHFGVPGDVYGKLGNAGTRLDMALLSPGHLYKKDGGFDPEGFLGTLPAVVNVLAGYLAGLLVQRGGDLRDGLRVMLVAGLGCIAAAHAWEPWFPIAKKLWTSPFVLLTTGLDLLLLAWTIWIIELRGKQGGRSLLHHSGAQSAGDLSVFGNVCHPAQHGAAGRGWGLRLDRHPPVSGDRAGGLWLAALRAGLYDGVLGGGLVDGSQGFDPQSIRPGE